MSVFLNMSINRCILLLWTILQVNLLSGQDLSNKGKDFWLGYGYHFAMAGKPANGGSQDMVLYFTSDKNASVKVEIPAVNYSKSYTVTANAVTISDPMPKTGTQDCKIDSDGKFSTGIHITSDVPIVAYAHIYDQSVSGASLLFPTNTLGKDYYSINYTQSSNANNANSFFFVVATEDNTTVEITPSATNVNNKPPGVPFTVTLNTGEIYNVMGTVNGKLGSDLTGSRIRSISSGGTVGCKKIAVFSGSGKMSIGGTAGGSADNLFAQAFPAVAWGKKYLTAPTGSQPNNYYRVCVKDPSTVVKLNGNILPATSLINGFYYQFKNGNETGTNAPVPNLIESDQPILVAQYCTTQGQDGNPTTGSGGDPEMIYLSPVEQTISNITLYSTNKYLILQSYINIIIKNTGIASFTLDGANISSSFKVHPQDANYSYAIVTVNSGSHTLKSNVGFNAIAYGFGNAESYGYNAGTNIQDFSPLATFKNPYSTIDSAVTCINTPLQFSVPLSFTPLSIQWDFSAAPNISPNTSIGPIANPVAESTRSIGGQTLQYYGTGGTIYTFSASNNGGAKDTIKLYATSATPDGCGNLDQVFTIPVSVKELPVAGFNFTHAGCLSDAVQFTNQSSTSGGNINTWIWDYGDGTNSSLNSSSFSPKLYTVAGKYQIKLKVATDIGCVSNELTQPIEISSKPIASFTVPPATCENQLIQFTDASSIQTGTIAKWTWDLDNGNGTYTNNDNSAQKFTYPVYGLKDVKLMVTSSTGCKSDTFRLTPQFRVNPSPVPGFVLPEICLNDASAQFLDSTKIIDGTHNFVYQWNFNAGSPAVSPAPTISGTATTSQNPFVKYNKADYYKVSLTVSSNGCTATLVSDFTVNGANPVADFEILKPTELCSNDSVRLKNLSTVDFGNLTRLEIFWDANDLTKKTTDENPAYQKIYAYRYPNFQSPAAKNYTITLKAYSGNATSCITQIIQGITVKASPKVAFTQPPGICNDGNPIQLTQGSFDPIITGSVSYNGNGVSAAGLFSPKFVGAGLVPIKYLFVADNGCRDSVIRNINVWASPQAKWSAPGILCQRQTIQFLDSSVSTFSNIKQRLWNFGDGKPAVTLNNNTTTITRQFDAAKNYSVSLQIISDSSCVSDVNVQTLHINYMPDIAFTLPNICLPDGRGTFLNQSTIGDGSASLFSYLWNFNDPNDPTPSTLKDPTHRYSALGPYPTELQITTKDGCVGSLQKSLVTIFPQPKASFSYLPVNICAGDTVYFKDLGDGMTSAAVQWNWDLAQKYVSQLQNPQRVFADTGIYKVSYYFFNAQGCVSDTNVQQLTINPYPKVTMPSILRVLEGSGIPIKPLYVFGHELQYLWKPSIYLNCDTAAVPITEPLDDITYQLYLTGIGGCTVNDSTFIKVLRLPIIPNAFSPNGDGINDTWKIKYLQDYPGAEVKIFNRYGQLIYEAVGYDAAWDGSFKGKPLPVGTYYYIVNPKNGRGIMNGAITIIK